MTLTINPDDWKKVLAEVVGTFLFFFIGIGSLPLALSVPGELVILQMFIVALAHGLGLALAISALGHISGGHFNPAVTIAMAVTRKISPLMALFYIIAQIAGGVAACLGLIAFMPRATWQFFELGTPRFNTQVINEYQAIFLEAVLTFFLVLVIFGTAVDSRGPKVAGFAIGLTVMVDILIGGQLTGGVMNPARALTPAIVGGYWYDDQLIYWVGPIIGAVLAALLYNFVFLPRPDDEVVETDLLDDDETIDPPMSEPNLTKG